MDRTGLSPCRFPYTRTPIDGVVAVEPAGQAYRVFVRGDHGVTFHDYPFSPFVFLSDPALASTAPVSVTHHRLTGNGGLCWLTEVASWHDWCLLREHLLQCNRPEAWFVISDRYQQFLIASGINFFKGVAFNNLRSLCISVQKGDQTMLAIAVTDGCNYQEVISGESLSEAVMLERLTQIIQAYDPDVITGYQLNTCDLPYIVRRAEQHRIRLGWGRNGSELHQPYFVDHQATTQHYEMYGRTVVDCEALVRHYDRHVLPLPGTDLQQAAKWFGLTAFIKTTGGAVLDMALMTIELYQLLAPAWYQQVQVYPISYQKLFCSPRVSAVHGLLIREYLHQQHALPVLTPALKLAQHHDVELFQQGQAGPVVYCDFSSLPAAIMSAYRIAPRIDELGIFSRLLNKALQQSVLQQSANHSLMMSAWYELLSNSHYLFSDTEAASEVDRLWHVIINDIVTCLKEQGATPVVVNQQGIYFVPLCDHQDGNAEVSELVQRLCLVLPQGFDLHATRPYPSIFVYKPNQFALKQDNGEIIFRGSSFALRSMEPFLREFLVEAIRFLLAGDWQAVEQLYTVTVRRLADHGCPVAWVARSETLADSREHYELAVQNGNRNRAAVYELALAKKGNWRIGEKISYYVTGVSKNCIVHANCKLVTDFDCLHPDINRAWYIERLYQLFKRFKPFLPAEPVLFK